MTDKESYLPDLVKDFFLENQHSLSDYLAINAKIKEVSGINDFFTSQQESTKLLTQLREKKAIDSEPDRRAYGDFQTNKDLANRVVKYSLEKDAGIEFVLEPTCGKGNFILATIAQCKSLKKVVGVEIYKPYVWKTKTKILTYFLENHDNSKPEIDIIHGNVFEFDYAALADSTRHLKLFIIGNPPWVTNSELGSIDSGNLPAKSNFKKHKGVDAITGKGNFDIGEYISQKMLECFDRHNGIFSFLIKSAVAKNLIQDQRKNLFQIGGLEKLDIDSKKEFNVSVKACLLFAHLNEKPAFTCKEWDFYSGEYKTTFGWYKDKFVSSVDDYDKSGIIDGKSVFTWRSGVKHDCAKVMEIRQVKGHFVNGLNEEVKLEKDLVYGLIKSADLKGEKTKSFRKLTIITQRKTGQDTDYIKNDFPLTYQYLSSHKAFFDKRKSSIYNNMPDFSIFGIGDYSFANYKVAISGLYKSTYFTLVYPDDAKPIMLDDTCYFIGFEQLKMAEIAHYLLNADLVQQFLKSIIFSDSKRAVNKGVLMRIDFERVFGSLSFKDAKTKIEGLKLEDWIAFGELAKEK